MKVGYLTNTSTSKIEVNQEGENQDAEPKFELTIENKNNKPKEEHEGMVWIPGTSFLWEVISTMKVSVVSKE